MATAGPNYPGTQADDAAVGTQTWSNPSRIVSSNNQYATASFSKSGAGGSGYTHYLKATNFGFTLPAGATIGGIAVEIERKSNYNSSPAQSFDHVVSLIVGGAVTGNNKAATSTAWGTSDATITYGGSSDKWGLSPGAADINASDFGVAFEVRINSGGGINVTASVDMIRVTVTYTEAAATYKQSRSLLGVGW